MTALCEIQCTGARLESLNILLFSILAIENLVPSKLLIVALVVVSGIEIQLVIDDGIEPFPVCLTQYGNLRVIQWTRTSVKDEAINTNFFVFSNANFVYQAGLVGDGAKSRQKPAIAVAALTNIASSSVIDRELWVLENFLCWSTIAI